MESIERSIIEFLEETAEPAGLIDSLPAEKAVELYDMYDNAAKIVTAHRAEVDPDLRVRICTGRDNILERVIDDMPPLATAHKSIYTPAIKNYDRWRNVELLKDCGLVVYMLGKEAGLRPVMLFGKEGEEFPYKDVLPGMEVICTDKEPGDITVYYKHLSENYEQMDVIAHYGLYPYTPAYLNMYRQLRADGKVYLALDMNRHWMGRIPWGSDVVVKAASQCDVIATSCRKMRDALNANPDVSFPCHWITNGFFNPTGLPVAAEADRKENIIISVGTVGDDQKNNMELMIAFAIAAGDLPDWTLRIVGGIVPAFLPQIDAFFAKYPALKERIIFTGAITDKAELYKEYARAKIFAMTSTYECFPNVYAEALFHGCMFVTSSIDAADEMINYGELGMKYETGDYMTLAASLIKICSYADKAAFKKHIPRALKYANRYFDWHRIARKLAYIMFK